MPFSETCKASTIISKIKPSYTMDITHAAAYNIKERPINKGYNLGRKYWNQETKKWYAQTIPPRKIIFLAIMYVNKK
jgi:myo-inositol catabolism protein IolC